MGISDGLQGSAAEVDCSAGTIVWVRRRNGSWWPGKILGSDELSASHLMSPRSGTPVKLLGREDASVDWYNLEKSKRVKAFRCGEFDDCIDKAEKSQGVPIKKREKYARREDAILHALEIERQQLEKKHKKLVNANSASSKKGKVLKKELGSSSDHFENSGSKFVNLRSQPLTKRLESALKEENTSNPSFSQKGNHGKQSGWQNDKPEAIPRMRGLQDFGLRIAPKRKNPPVVSEGTRRPRLSDNHVHDLPSGSRSFGSADPVTSSKDLLDNKRKRTQGGLEESLTKRRDRRRPLVKVLQSSAKLSANHTLQSAGDISPSMHGENEQGGVICRAKRSRYVFLPSGLNDTECPDEMQTSPSHYERDDFHLTPCSLTEEKTPSELMEKAESDSSRSDPDMDEEQTVLSDTNLTKPMIGPDNGCIQEPTTSTTDDELDDAVAINDYMSPHHSYDHTSTANDARVSKWQLKGKRNTRNVMKRPTSKSSKRSNVPIDETYLEGKGYYSNPTALEEQRRYHASEGLDYDYEEDEVVEKKSMHNQMLDFGSRRYPSMLKGVSKNSHKTKIGNVNSGEHSIWEADKLSQAAFRGYWEESVECYDPLYSGSRLGSGKDSMLVDVDLKVQASYQGEHVPLVSLMSRLNGKAIIGHPIQIEVLEDGFSDVFLSTNEDLSEELIDNDGSTALRPVWRTARRTNMHRVPRPHPSTGLNGDDTGDQLQFLVPESKPPYNKLNAVNPAQMLRKSSDVCGSLGKKFPKKPTKKASLTSQKTRTLSSFALEQKLHGKGGSHKINRSGLDGLIKPETGPTTVTCIPLKLVFSRLLEAVGRPPSRPANHIMTMDGDKERR